MLHRVTVAHIPAPTTFRGFMVAAKWRNPPLHRYQAAESGSKWRNSAIAQLAEALPLGVPAPAAVSQAAAK
jgi:hypothetical protein